MIEAPELNIIANKLSAITLDYTDALKAPAKSIETYAKSNAPYRTGFLRASVYETNNKDSITVGDSAPYSGYVEDKNPFIERAFEENNSEIIKAVEDATAKQIEEAL